MGIQLGNKWDCDNPECQNHEFVPRDAENLVPKGWFNTEVDGGKAAIASCSADCIGKALAALSTKNSS